MTGIRETHGLAKLPNFPEYYIIKFSLKIPVFFGQQVKAIIARDLPGKVSGNPVSQLRNSVFRRQAEIVRSDIISHLVVRVTIDEQAVHTFIMTIACHSP